MTKRILMLTSTWDSDYSKAIVAGIIDRIGDDDIKLHIFNAYDDMEYEFYRKAREIYSLSDPSNFDGLLLALPTVAAVDYISSITERFHEYNKPIVGIDTHAENAIFCGLDNYRSMYQLVDHMITIHDCRNLNYLGGPEDHKENMERFSAFCDCLKDHGLRIQNKRVLHKRYRRNNGIDAYNEWKELGVNMADAVICANDFMALGYVEAAVKDGMMIPDYMKVTGFDNIIEGQTYSPSITSINRNWKSLGYESMDALIEAMNNETEFDTRFVEGSIAFNESCGCSLMRDIRSDYNELIGRVKSENEVARRQGYVRQLLF
ncbi:MAG: substrate-binding domain-containing protein, partial [Lachnospiraceae bacterium]|nr:substrate-binding domain-containing protein [Lachnospiraceae bacterium]